MGKNRSIVFICFCLFAVLLSSCGRHKLEAKEYIKWVDESEILSSTKVIGNIEFTMRYIPAEYMLLKEIAAGKNVSKEVFNQKLKEQSKLIYINLQVKDLDSHSEAIRSGVRSMEDLSQKINHMSFNAQKDFELIQCDSLKKCVLYHFERSYDLASHNKIVMAFENNGHCESDIKLKYDDQVFDTGIINLVITKEQLAEVPALDLVN